MAKKINYGEYAFLGGIVLAFIVGVLAGFLPVEIVPFVMALLFVLGIVVGLVNISEKEVNSFLIAAIALLLAVASWNTMLGATLSLLGDLGVVLSKWIVGFTSALVVFISPAAFIVAIKAVYNLGRSD